MSKLAKAKKAAGYDPDPPSCYNCAHHKMTVRPHAGGKQNFHHWCGLQMFNVVPRGICDKWTGHDKSVLEALAPTP